MKILVAYHGTNVGNEILKTAVKHAKAFGDEVLLMTSLEGDDKTDLEEINKAETDLRNASKRLDKEDVPNEAHLIVKGHTPGEDIVAFAEEQECSEIIIGVKSRSKVGKFLFGSTAQYVILNAHCPVVSVK